MTLLLGVVVGVVGTVMHRWQMPWGVAICLVLVVAAAVTSRAWAGWPTWITYCGGVFFAVQALAQTGPGGDVLVPTGQVIGWVWVIGSIAAALLTGLLPGRLFRERPSDPSGPAADAPASAPWPLPDTSTDAPLHASWPPGASAGQPAAPAESWPQRPEHDAEE